MTAFFCLWLIRWIDWFPLPIYFLQFFSERKWNEKERVRNDLNWIEFWSRERVRQYGLDFFIYFFQERKKNRASVTDDNNDANESKSEWIRFVLLEKQCMYQQVAAIVIVLIDCFDSDAVLLLFIMSTVFSQWFQRITMI